jgi:hypothetical protein
MMKKWSLTLKVFVIVAAACLLYVLIASIVRVSIGQISILRAVIRFIIFGLIGGSIVGGIAAGITALIVAIKKLGE